MTFFTVQRGDMEVNFSVDESGPHDFTGSAPLARQIRARIRSSLGRSGHRKSYQNMSAHDVLSALSGTRLKVTHFGLPEIEELPDGAVD